MIYEYAVIVMHIVSVMRVTCYEHLMLAGGTMYFSDFVYVLTSDPRRWVK